MSKEYVAAGMRGPVRASLICTIGVLAFSLIGGGCSSTAPRVVTSSAAEQAQARQNDQILLASPKVPPSVKAMIRKAEASQAATSPKS